MGRRSAIGTVGTIAGTVVVLLLLVLIFGACGYIQQIDQHEVAIKFESGRAVDLVGPGLEIEFGPFKSIEVIDRSGIPFSAVDPEVLTSDQQRIGLEVSGTVHRPGMERGKDAYIELWSTYQTFLVDDNQLTGVIGEGGGVVQTGLMQDLSKQAMKVCVGDRTFVQAAVGASRDALGECIQEELQGRAAVYGLDVKNVLVPDIIIDDTVKRKLDEITEAKFATDKARQDKLLAEAEGERELAKQQADIRVQQGIVQETRRQEAITADLERQSLEAQQAVISAQKANDLQKAQLEIEIAEQEFEAEKVRAQIKIAPEIARAELLAGNPAYANVLIQEFWAGAYKVGDKIILPAGTDPITILGGSSANVLVDGQ